MTIDTTIANTPAAREENLRRAEELGYEVEFRAVDGRPDRLLPVWF